MESVRPVCRVLAIVVDVTPTTAERFECLLFTTGQRSDINSNRLFVIERGDSRRARAPIPVTQVADEVTNQSDPRKLEDVGLKKALSPASFTTKALV